MNTELLATVEGGAAPGWYNVAPWSPNLECKNGYAYTSTNMKKGFCRWRYDIMVHNVTNNIAGGSWGVCRDLSRN